MKGLSVQAPRIITFGMVRDDPSLSLKNALFEKTQASAIVMTRRGFCFLLTQGSLIMLWLGFTPPEVSAPPPVPPVPPVPPEDEALDASSVTPGVEVSQLTKPLACSKGSLWQSWLPWGVSIGLHILLVLGALWLIWSAQKVQENQIIVPLVRLSTARGVPLEVRQEKTELRSQSSQSHRSVDSVKAAVQTDVRRALGSKVEVPKQIRFSAFGRAESNPFGMGVGEAPILKARFFGTGAQARKVVYLVDASGSLVDTLPFVITELQRSIGSLVAQQQFTVLFFQGDRAMEVPPVGLKFATAINKKAVCDWIAPKAGHVTAQGLSSPLVALRVALGYEPNLLFLLSDNITGRGKYKMEQQKLLAQIRQANKAQTRINAIQFLYQDSQTASGGKSTLQLIAQENRGTYKFLDEKELKIQ